MEQLEYKPKDPKKMSMAELRLAIELLEDAAMAGQCISNGRLMMLSKERMKRIYAGIKSHS